MVLLKALPVDLMCELYGAALDWQIVDAVTLVFGRAVACPPVSQSARRYLSLLTEFWRSIFSEVDA
jgi:hypothetical protein